MPTKKRLTISDMGGIKPYMNALAELNKNGQDYAWFDSQCARIDAKEATKKEVYEAMGIAQNTFGKYYLLRNIERVQHGK